ncbi:sugar phosphate isomerase/epimerase family protein [Qingshengfaniella alkalisoli]|uniref:Sugar phosphate isomerase/epimerase n=1 Tax=Qingshengfaniella alkalisoli TaxID=2599296 RepID=A0A5B8IPH8_9RHOB|nr:sugar phosphate isomerase/epimerase family protein [Qingshengfaniella alkalisoli]QDY68222.1 sugar phosphate isomerase/epimerase [Qingshengfaniella alkalisoli]
MDNPIGIISMQFIRPFTGKDLHYFQKAADLGFDFVELLVPEPEDNLDPAETRRAAEDAGLSLVLAARVNPQRSIASEDPSARQGGIDYLKHCVDAAEGLGARIIGGPLYGEPMVFAGRPPMPRSDEDIAARAERTVNGLAEVAPVAAAAGKVFGLEPLNRFETDIISTTRQAIEVVDKVNNPGLGVMLDTFHMNMEERSIPDAIRATGDRLVHFQANENHRGHAGTGHIDWTAVMRALHHIGYKGPISLEPFRRDDDRVALPIAHWRAPREDESAKLRAGLGVIRSALALAEVAQ